MQSKATTVAEYLASLPADRRTAIRAVRDVIRRNLDQNYVEGMQYGMIGYAVPHRVFPAGYHCDPKQPLPFAALASQKNYMSVHLMGIYMDNQQSHWFRDAWAATGRKLDMGKACLRFKKVDDLALDVLGEAIRRMPAQRYVEIYTSLLAKTRDGGKQSKTAKKPVAPKKSAPKKKVASKAARKN